MDITQALGILNGNIKLPKRLKDKLEIWRSIYYAISLHTTGTCPAYLVNNGWVYPPMYICKEYQWLFDNRLMNRHPNESEASRWYRYSIYRPLTKEPFIRAIGVVSGAIFQDSNYNIELPDKDDSEYINGNNFEGYDLIGYFSNIGIHNIVEDPNGVFVRMPENPYYEQTNKKIEVEIKFVNSKDIVYLDDDCIIFKECDEDEAYYIDKQVIWRFKLKDGKKYGLDMQDVEGYYAHMLGYLPITIAGGEWNSHGYYDSYFDSAKALCDEFISTFSAAQVVDKEASHPFIVAAQEDCPSCKGNGQIRACNTCHLDENKCQCENSDYTNYGLATCRTCHGTGRQSRNPMQWQLVPYEQLKDGVDHIKFISPDIAINKHHRETIKTLRDEIMQALHLYRADATQSGVAKEIDQEGLYQFLGKLSNHLFDKVIYDTIKDIIAYRNVTVMDGQITPAIYNFTITKPTQFRVKTEGALLDEYKTGTEAKLPILLRQKQSSEYANKAYSGDAVLKRKLDLTELLDECNLYTTDEILNLRVAGAITIEDVKFHQKLPKYMNELVTEKGEEWFINTDIETIAAILDSKRTVTNDLSGSQSTTA